MGLPSTIYNTVFKKTSSMALASVICVFVFERTFDLGVDILFDKLNEGKLWHQIKDKYQ